MKQVARLVLKLMLRPLGFSIYYDADEALRLYQQSPAEYDPDGPLFHEEWLAAAHLADSQAGPRDTRRAAIHALTLYTQMQQGGNPRDVHTKLGCRVEDVLRYWANAQAFDPGDRSGLPDIGQIRAA